MKHRFWLVPGLCVLTFCAAAPTDSRRSIEALLASRTLSGSPSISITGAPDSLLVGDTVSVTATPHDVLGRKSPSSRLTWAERPNGSLSVTPIDAKEQHVLFTGLAPATVIATATWTRSDGLVVTDSVRVVVYAPPVVVPVDTTPTVDTTKTVVATSTSEPVFDSTTATMVYADNLDSYTTATLMPPCQPLTGPRFYDRAYDGCAIGYVADTNRVFVIPGRSGSAVRVSYTGTYQESWNITAGGFPDTQLQTAVVQVWSRLTGSIGAIKWIELFHNTGGRIQFNTHDHLPCPIITGAFGITWQVYDSLQTTCQANQPVGPNPSALVDGQWHRYTYLYKPNSAPGKRDGRALMWIDGTLIIRIELSAVGVTPPGGFKTWCELDDLDALSSRGFVEANFGGPLTTTPGPFTYDIDDFRLWVLK